MEKLGRPIPKSGREARPLPHVVPAAGTDYINMLTTLLIAGLILFLVAALVLRRSRKTHSVKDLKGLTTKLITPDAWKSTDQPGRFLKL